jgi:acetyltransferase
MTYEPGEAGVPAAEWRAADGTRLLIRPMRPDDAVREQAFVQGLSAASKQLRFMNAVRELSPRQLQRFTHPDPAREFVLVALRQCAGSPDEQVAVARFALDAGGEGCEFAIAVADPWQRRGLGRHLMTRLIDAARARGLRVIWGQVSAGNHGMLALARALGFGIRTAGDEPGVRQVILRLDQPGH